MTNQMQMTVDVRKNGLQWCRWCFLLRGIFPREVSMNWLIINYKIQTKTNALIYQFSEMWSIIQEKHDITVRWREKYPWVHCLSLFYIYIERNSITKNTRVLASVVSRQIELSETALEIIFIIILSFCVVSPVTFFFT